MKNFILLGMALFVTFSEATAQPGVVITKSQFEISLPCDQVAASLRSDCREMNDSFRNLVLSCSNGCSAADAASIVAEYRDEMGTSFAEAGGPRLNELCAALPANNFSRAQLCDPANPSRIAVRAFIQGMSLEGRYRRNFDEPGVSSPSQSVVSTSRTAPTTGAAGSASGSGSGPTGPQVRSTTPSAPGATTPQARTGEVAVSTPTAPSTGRGAAANPSTRAQGTSSAPARGSARSGGRIAPEQFEMGLRCEGVRDVALRADCDTLNSYFSELARQCGPQASRRCDSETARRVVTEARDGRLEAAIGRATATDASGNKIINPEFSMNRNMLGALCAALPAADGGRLCDRSSSSPGVNAFTSGMSADLPSDRIGYLGQRWRNFYAPERDATAAARQVVAQATGTTTPPSTATASTAGAAGDASGGASSGQSRQIPARLSAQGIDGAVAQLAEGLAGTSAGSASGAGSVTASRATPPPSAPASATRPAPAEVAVGQVEMNPAPPSGGQVAARGTANPAPARVASPAARERSASSPVRPGGRIPPEQFHMRLPCDRLVPGTIAKVSENCRELNRYFTYLSDQCSTRGCTSTQAAAHVAEFRNSRNPGFGPEVDVLQTLCASLPRGYGVSLCDRSAPENPAVHAFVRGMASESTRGINRQSGIERSEISTYRRAFAHPERDAATDSRREEVARATRAAATPDDGVQESLRTVRETGGSEAAAGVALVAEMRGAGDASGGGSASATVAAEGTANPAPESAPESASERRRTARSGRRDSAISSAPPRRPQSPAVSATAEETAPAETTAPTVTSTPATPTPATPARVAAVPSRPGANCAEFQPSALAQKCRRLSRPDRYFNDEAHLIHHLMGGSRADQKLVRSLALCTYLAAEYEQTPVEPTNRRPGFGSTSGRNGAEINKIISSFADADRSLQGRPTEVLARCERKGYLRDVVSPTGVGVLHTPYSANRGPRTQDLLTFQCYGAFAIRRNVTEQSDLRRNARTTTTRYDYDPRDRLPESACVQECQIQGSRVRERTAICGAQGPNPAGADATRVRASDCQRYMFCNRTTMPIVVNPYLRDGETPSSVPLEGKAPTAGEAL